MSAIRGVVKGYGERKRGSQALRAEFPPRVGGPARPGAARVVVLPVSKQCINSRPSGAGEAVAPARRADARLWYGCPPRRGRPGQGTAGAVHGFGGGSALPQAQGGRLPSVGQRAGEAALTVAAPRACALPTMRGREPGVASGLRARGPALPRPRSAMRTTARQRQALRLHTVTL